MALAQSTRLLHAIGCDSEFVSPGLHLQRDRGRTGGGLTRDDAFHARHKFRALPHSDAAFADCRTLAIRHGELQRSSAASWDHDIELGQADRPWRPTARCSHRRPRDRHGPSNRVHTAVDGWRLPWHRRAARDRSTRGKWCTLRRRPAMCLHRCGRRRWPLRAMTARRCANECHSLGHRLRKHQPHPSYIAHQWLDMVLGRVGPVALVRRAL